MMGCVTEYGYDDAGQLVRVAVNGHASAYEYDAAGNIAAVTDAEGRRVAFGYDLARNMTEIIYPDGAKDTTEYDLLGRVARYVPRTGLLIPVRFLTKLPEHLKVPLIQKLL